MKILAPFAMRLLLILKIQTWRYLFVTLSSFQFILINGLCLFFFFYIVFFNLKDSSYLSSEYFLFNYSELITFTLN
jgi:hypothetical protein